MTILNKVSNKTLMPGITPVADVVDAPTIGTATDAGTGTSATVSYTAAVTGGTATSFTAISTPGSVTGSSATSPITVTGLTSGTSYTFKVYGVNASGTWSGVQSSASNSVTLTYPTTFESIATVTGSGTSSITFSSIPSTYKNLQIRFVQFDNTTGDMYMTMNGITTTSYSRHRMYADGATVGVNAQASQTSIFVGLQVTAAGPTYPSFGVVDILDYSSTTKNKTARIFAGKNSNGTGDNGTVELASGAFYSTSAVTSITLTNTLSTFNSNTKIALYGIKGS